MLWCEAGAGARGSVGVVAVPEDCSDGFGEAFYARPEAFLDTTVRGFTSGLALTDPAAVSAGVDRLVHDFARGACAGCSCSSGEEALTPSVRYSGYHRERQ